MVMSIHSFGDYPDKFHPHIHAIVSDGLFARTRTFYVMPEIDLKPLEEIFRASVFKMLKDEGKIGDDLINRLMSWRHSGFSVHNGLRVRRDDAGGKEALAQYTCPPLGTEAFQGPAQPRGLSWKWGDSL